MPQYQWFCEPQWPVLAGSSHSDGDMDWTVLKTRFKNVQMLQYFSCVYWLLLVVTGRWWHQGGWQEESKCSRPGGGEHTDFICYFNLMLLLTFLFFTFYCTSFLYTMCVPVSHDSYAVLCSSNLCWVEWLQIQDEQPVLSLPTLFTPQTLTTR